MRDNCWLNVVIRMATISSANSWRGGSTAGGAGGETTPTCTHVPGNESAQFYYPCGKDHKFDMYLQEVQALAKLFD